MTNQTTYTNRNIGPFGVRIEVDNSPIEPRPLWQDTPCTSKGKFNPEKFDADYYALYSKFRKFRTSILGDTGIPPLKHGLGSPIDQYQAQEIREGRFVPLTVDDLHNESNHILCDEFATDINTFLKEWV